MTHLQIIVGILKGNVHCNVNDVTFIMANHEIIEFIAIMQRWIDKFKINFY